MGKEQFVDFNRVRKVLEDNGFFGFTCKRGDGRLTYSYRSISYHCVLITVVVAKLQPKDLNSRKIVLTIKINGKNLEGWEDFKRKIREVWKYQREEFPKTFRKVYDKADGKHQEHGGNSKRRAFNNRTDGKDVQVVREEARKKE